MGRTVKAKSVRFPLSRDQNSTAELGVAASSTGVTASRRAPAGRAQSGPFVPRLALPPLSCGQRRVPSDLMVRTVGSVSLLRSVRPAPGCWRRIPLRCVRSR